jgi:mRNA interferase MazF
MSGSGRRGEVWLVRLDPTIGHELQKTRPCVIVSPDGMNAHLGTLGVLPMTSGSHEAPFRLQTTFRNVDGLLLGDQLRFVSRQRLVRRLGQLPASTLSIALQMMREMFEE